MYKKYFWVKNLIFLCLLSYLLAKIGNTLLLASMQPAQTYPNQTPATRSAGRSVAGQDALHRYRLISQKNIFNSAYTGDGEGGPREKRPKNTTPLKITDLDVTLIGTVVGPSQNSFAIIEDPKTREQELFQVDDMIQNEARVVAISRCKVVVLRAETEEILECPEPESSRSTAPPPVRDARSLAKKESFGVKKLSEDAYMVDEAEVAKALGNLNQLLTQVRLGPNFTDGKPDGFKLLGMNRESIFAKAGLKDGDVIRKVNGLDISSADRAFQAFQELQNEKNFSVEISRGGETKSLSYEIQ